ncbi:MAG: NAD(P)-dependent oxidoreductase [Bacteroidetes bacterium]|nr:NAD(P)-dependent oxidoreductase [Bacteroidota bacterium]
MSRKILITGASGFIGSFLVEEAIRQGLEVYAGIRKSSRLEFLNLYNIQLLELNLSAPDELTKALSDFQIQHGSFDYVIHNAGITSAHHPNEFYEVNCLYTKNLMKALHRTAMPLTRFMLISSLATYGPGCPITLKPIDVTDDECPVSAYARSKKMAEEFVKSSGYFPTTILKPTAVFGPRDKDFLRLFKMINHGFEITLGSHRQILSLIYVKDFSHIAITLLKEPAANQTFLVSDGQHYTNEELNGIIRSALNKRTIRLSVPLKPLQAIVKTHEKWLAHSGNTRFLNSEKLTEISAVNWACNSRPVWEETRLQPRYHLADAIRETAAWYKQNGWLK